MMESPVELPLASSVTRATSVSISSTSFGFGSEKAPLSLRRYSPPAPSEHISTGSNTEIDEQPFWEFGQSLCVVHCWPSLSPPMHVRGRWQVPPLGAQSASLVQMSPSFWPLAKQVQTLVSGLTDMPSGRKPRT